MTDQDYILLELQNPSDPAPEEIAPLATKISSLHPDYKVGIAYFRPSQEGHAAPQVSLWEVLIFWIPAQIGAAAIGELVHAAVEHMKKRFKVPHHEERPKCIKIVRYTNEQGEVLEIIDIESVDGPLTRRPPDEHERNPRPKPPIQDD